MKRSRLLSLAIAAGLAAGAVHAQTPTPGAPVPEKTPPGASPAPNLSQKLDQSNGVIRPKEVDPAMEKPAPRTGDENAIPPSKAPAPAPSAEPK